MARNFIDEAEHIESLLLKKLEDSLSFSEEIEFEELLKTNPGFKDLYEAFTDNDEKLESLLKNYAEAATIAKQMSLPGIRGKNKQ